MEGQGLENNFDMGLRLVFLRLVQVPEDQDVSVHVDACESARRASGRQGGRSVGSACGFGLGFGGFGNVKSFL